MSADDDVVAVGAGQSAGVDRPCPVGASPDPARWIEDHGDALYRFAMIRLNDAGDAEEAVQECLLAALRGAESFTGQSMERTWLIGILKHKIVDHVRRTARDRGAKEERSVDQSRCFDDRGFWRIVPKRWHEDPSVAIQRKEFAAILFDCLGKLPSGMADVVVLRELNQLSGVDVCETLSISQQTLWQRLHRARLGLRRCLELNWFDKAVLPILVHAVRGIHGTHLGRDGYRPFAPRPIGRAAARDVLPKLPPLSQASSATTKHAAEYRRALAPPRRHATHRRTPRPHPPSPPPRHTVRPRYLGSSPTIR